MNYYVFNNTMKYDNIGNEGKGLYRTWVCEIEPRDPEEYKSIWVRHDEVFDREFDHWRTLGKTTHEIEMDDKKYDTLKCVKPEECSESDMWLMYEPLQRKGDTFIFDKKSGKIHGNNRSELIRKYKQYIIDKTNISNSPDEMKVLDNILLRLWELGLLDNLELLSKLKKAYAKFEEVCDDGDDDKETKYWFKLGDLLAKIKEV